MSHPHPDPHEEAIDTTLAALRQSDPPSGLEQRILRNLAERAAETPHARRHFLWLGIPAAACAILVVSCVKQLRPHDREPVAVTRQTALPPPTQASPSHPERRVQFSVTEAIGSRPRQLSRSHRSRISPKAAFQAATAPPVTPLTQQERMLVRIARSGDPNQLAMLIPEVRARDEAEHDAEFRQFFNSPHTQIP